MPRLPLAPGNWHLESCSHWAKAHQGMALKQQCKSLHWQIPQTQLMGPPTAHPPVRWPLPSLLPEWAERELAGLWICNLRRKGSVWNGIVFPGVPILPHKRKSVLSSQPYLYLKAIKHDRDWRQLSVGQCESCLPYLQQGWRLSCLFDGHPRGLKWSSNVTTAFLKCIFLSLFFFFKWGYTG